MRTLPIAVAAVLGPSSIAFGEPLNLDLFDTPDVVSQFIDVVYDASTDSLALSGFALEFDDDGIGDSFVIADGIFDVDVTVDEFGNASSGTLLISGIIADLGLSGDLLQGDLTAFGYPNAGGDPLEFLFDVTGGGLASYYGTSAGVILGGSEFPGSFGADFDNLIGGQPGTGTGSSDTAPPIPAPASLMLLLPGVALASRRR